jgi:hypothetical protein
LGVDDFTSWTSAQGSDRCLDAAVGAGSAVALVGVAFWAFISAVGTVQMIITNFVDGNANALKTRTLPLSRLARNLWSSASMFGGFVTSVSTIVLSVTDERFVNALFVVALEVVGLAVDSAAGGGLVGLVLTVDSAVTMPAGWDADSGRLTSELFLRTLIRSHGRASEFVRSVVTIRNSVAFVRLMDALLPVVALELRPGAGDRWTVLLVGVVEAVVVAVAAPGLWDAVAGVFASKLEISASFFCAEVSFVGSISAIVLAVTFPGARDAAAVAASELARLAGHVQAAVLI